MTGPDRDEFGQGQASGMVSVLSRLRAAARAQLVVQRLGLLGAAFVGYVILAGLIDYFLRMPTPVRVVLWLGSVGVLAVMVKRYLLPAILFNPSLTHVALRVEQSPEGQKAGLKGVLASALELSAGDPQSVLGAELRIMTAEQARRRFTGAISTNALLAKRRLGHALVALVAVAIPTLALLMTNQELARIGTARVLTPWSSAAWPKRTGVVDANPVVAHAAGTALPLRAVLSRTTKMEGQTKVTVTYRVITDGKAGITQRALLTAQNKVVEVEPLAGAPVVKGELYERLLDTASMMPSRKPGTPTPKIELEYAFETADDETEFATVTLVEPPAIVAGRVEVVAPAYATTALASQNNSAAALFHGQKDAGPGRDERAAVGPILAGSRVTLNLGINKDLPVPHPSQQQNAADPELRKFLATAFPGLDLGEDLAVDLQSTDWKVTFTARNSMRVGVVLTDAYGIAASEDSAYRFDVVDDRPPAAVVVEPQQDEAILPTALIETAGEGRDDVGLAGVSLRHQVAKPPAGSAGAAPEPAADPVEMASAKPVQGSASTTLLRAAATLDVATLNVVPGDEVWVTAQVSDIFSFENANHPPVVSTKRRLKVIGESELIEQFRSELAGVREAAKRLEQDQDRLGVQRAEAAKDSQKASEQAQRQDVITDRLSPLNDALNRLTSRAERNRLEDKSLSGLLKDASELIKHAQEESDKASSALNKLSGNAPSSDQQQDQKDLEAAQKSVQDDLSQVANMLDRGQDTWAMKRAIEKLLAEQKQVTNQTASADPNMKGQEADKLTPQQREELERLAQRQQELAQRGASLIDQLQQRAEQMQQVDPAQAQSMQNAANKARQQQVDEKQRDAAEQIQQNKTDEAQEQQQQAEKALQSMLDEMEKGEQQRDQALRRVLADLIQSLDKLIKQQEGELSRLAKVMSNGSADNTLDAGMISLNQNTLGVLATIKAMKEAGDVAMYVDSAAGAQSSAIVALRSTDQPEADSNERISLARLNDAKAEAQKLEEEAQDREEQRKLEELKKAYKEALELQVALRAETQPLLGKDLDRRTRQTARALAERQEAIRVALAELRSNTQEFDDAKMFDYAHTRLDQTAASVSKTLAEGATPPVVGSNQTSIVRILQGLLDAVAEMEKKKDEFREEDGGDDGGGGGGGGGQQPLIPPIAELKLLRFMQLEAAELTRAASESGDTEQADHVTKLQGDLAQQAKALLEKMQEKQEPPVPQQPGPEQPGPEQPDPDDAKPDEPTPEPNQ